MHYHRLRRLEAAITLVMNEGGTLTSGDNIYLSAEISRPSCRIRRAFLFSACRLPGRPHVDAGRIRECMSFAIAKPQLTGLIAWCIEAPSA